MDEQEDASKQGDIIANIDADEDVILKDVAAIAKEVFVEKTTEIEDNADVQGRLEESQAQIYKIDLKHVDKILSMQDDELEPSELKEGMIYDDNRPIFKKYFNSNVAFHEKTKEQLEEEASRALKRASKSQAEKAAKKQKLDEELEELKKHL
nr:hypothetical protein [Tanacetum cinerariifolium]